MVLTTRRSIEITPRVTSNREMPRPVDTRRSLHNILKCCNSPAVCDQSSSLICRRVQLRKVVADIALDAPRIVPKAI